jgi:hypothetical protein
MQSTDIETLDQQAPEEASATVAETAPRKPGRPPGSKNKKTSKKKTGKKKSTKKKASKKKASKKKASKKKASKKKASKKKASKKKASKKKRSKKVATAPGTKKATRKKAGKKKASKKKASKKKASKKKRGKKKRGKKKSAAGPASSDSMARLMSAVEELREAVVEFAQTKTEDQQAVVAELRRSAQAKIADLEDAAVRSLKKLGL